MNPLDGPAADPVPGRTRPALVRMAMTLDWSDPTDAGRRLAAAADLRTRVLVDGFVHQAGPPPGRFAWVALGSHARGELHCASDQDHALIWDSGRAASARYAADLAATVIEGLASFGMRRCAGGYMADRWSQDLATWLDQARHRIRDATPAAVLDTDIFLDMRSLAGELDVSPAISLIQAGADSPRLLHGLAMAANSFSTPLGTFNRLPTRPMDVKLNGLAPLVLLARLYGVRAQSTEVSTPGRLRAAARSGVLSEALSDRLVGAFETITRIRLAHQVQQAQAGLALTDVITVGALVPAQQAALRDALRAVRAAQSVTSVTFRTDL